MSLLLNILSRLAFPGGWEVKASACNVGDLGSIAGSGRSPGGGNGNPLQCSCLENPRDGRALWAAVYGVTQSWTWLKWLSSSSSPRKLILHAKELSSKITSDGDCRHEIKRSLLLRKKKKKTMTNLESILTSRDITLATKVCLVKAMVFPVVMYGCESWTITKAESRRIDALELRCWRKLLGVSLTARRSNQ